MLANIRHALRLFAKNPLYTAVAVLTLSVGIGVNTATFSAADVLLFRPLDIPDLDNFYAVFGTAPGHPMDTDEITPGDFEDFRRESKLTEHLSATDWWNANITGTGAPERVQGFRVSGDFFLAAGVRPLLGRTLLPGEDSEGKDGVTVLSHALWLRRFGADPGVIGSLLELDGRKYQIVGVMPKGFMLPRSSELWVPLVFSLEERRHARGWFYLDAVARLKPGVTKQQAEQELKAIAGRIAGEFPSTHKGRGVRLSPYRDHVSGDFTAQYTMMLMGAVGFVLLIACVNVATLQLARVSLREREMAVRAALGASRGRLILQLLTESGLLGLLGAGAGLLFAIWGIDLLRGAMPAEVERYLPGWYRMGLNGVVLTFALSISVLSGVAAGVAPALGASKVNLQERLREGGRGGTLGVRRHRLRNLLVVAQVALAFVLLIGAGLMVKGFRALSTPYDRAIAASTLTMRVAMPISRYPDISKIGEFVSAVLENLRRLPGVDGAGIMMNLPYSNNGASSGITIEGAPPPAPGEQKVAQRQIVSPGVFAALGIPVLLGREISENDGKDTPPVALVNQAFARRHFSGGPIGRRFRFGDSGPWFTIVGIVKDVRHAEVHRSVRPAFFVSYRQAIARSFDIVIRTNGDPLTMIASARAQVLAVDRDQPVFDVRTLKKMVSDSLTGFTYVAVCMGVFGGIALLLATVGIYSVMASSVNERTHEIGVRMALGAKERQVLGMVLRNGVTLTSIGLVIGLAGGWALARALAGLIFGVSETDLASYILVALLVLVTAIAACWIPARRAMLTDPAIALREE